MKILIIRHADPNYEIDSLTETGWKEAELLAERIARMDVSAFYVSPLGRAQDTANCTLRKMGRTAETKPWLREFTEVFIDRPDQTKEKRICWDWLPADWTAREVFFDRENWYTDPIFASAGVKEKYDWVIDGLDELLKEHGYERNGLLYKAVRPSNETIALYCHFGVEAVLLSHLLNISPVQLWHGTCSAPTGVTTLATEERREGIAAFRMLSFGDTGHLCAAGAEPSFSGRFRECYTNTWERRDDYLGL